MKILLDTHTFLWVVDDSEALSKSLRELLQSEEHEVFLSIASLWEIAIKVALGKLVIPAQNIQSLVRIASERSTDVLAIRPAHLDRVRILPMHHRDPFDRIIISQAIEENMMLATEDSFMQRYPVSILK